MPSTFLAFAFVAKHRTLFNLRHPLRIPFTPASLALLGLCTVLSACAPEASGRDRIEPSTGLGLDVTLPSDPGQTDVDLGDDWAAIEARLNGQRATGQGGHRPGHTARRQPTIRRATPGVAIALATFTGEGHERMAAETLASLAPRAPEFAGGMAVHTDERGSMVVYGHYASFDDKSLKADLRRIKAFTVDGKRVFGLVLPAEVRLPLVLDDLHPLDLHRIRLLYPDVRVMYTLQVAWWGPTVSGFVPDDNLGKALQMAQQLRQQGHEAYFLQEPHRNRASVCVGIFDHTAKDGSSELESGEVMQVRQRFPALQINGTRALAPVDPNRPGGHTKPVPPVLIDVPRP